jgi:beta-glucosidase
VSPVTGLRERLGPTVAVTTADGRDVGRAVALARAADVAIVVVGDREREGADRSGIDLDGNQNDLVAAVAAANRRTIVVLNTGGPVTMPWLGDVGAVVEAWYPGQEDGHALAAVLTGDVNPSAKLPVTFPTGLGQDPAHDPPRYPARHGTYQYTERLEVGYRWYDAHDLTPLFPFGYGLSYTTFSLARLSVSPAAGPPAGVTVSFEVTNTGRRPGTETPQIYVGFPPSIGEPPQRLAAFAKVTLAPGKTQQVTVTLPPAAFSFWDIEGHRFATAAGDHTIAVGTSSRHLPLRASVHLAGTR